MTARVNLREHYLRRLILAAESQAEAEAHAGDVARAQAQIVAAREQGRAWRDAVLQQRQG